MAAQISVFQFSVDSAHGQNGESNRGSWCFCQRYSWASGFGGKFNHVSEIGSCLPAPQYPSAVLTYLHADSGSCQNNRCPVVLLPSSPEKCNDILKKKKGANVVETPGDWCKHLHPPPSTAHKCNLAHNAHSSLAAVPPPLFSIFTTSTYPHSIRDFCKIVGS